MIDNDNKSSAYDGEENTTRLSLIVERDINKESVKEFRSRYDQFIHSKYYVIVSWPLSSSAYHNCFWPFQRQPSYAC